MGRTTSILKMTCMLAILSAGPLYAIDFGDDSSEFSNNGECDDMRFEGKGMTATPLIEGDMLHDATDCKRFYDSGKVRFSLEGEMDFGDDTGEWSNDGECDDPRFDGPGMTTTPLLAEDIRGDATDCKIAFEAGRLWARGGDNVPEVVVDDGVAETIDFGQDTSEWANDGECDDPRFEGEGMTDTPLLEEDIRGDATDCRTAFLQGRLSLIEGAEGRTFVVGEVDFGDDSSQWANDGECDDPRFTGTGMTETTLLDEDIRSDASDCLAAYQEGTITFTGETAAGDESLVAGNVNFGDDSSEWANDGECDDPRFEGEGMTDTALLESDIRADATDCKAAFDAGTITLAGADGEGETITGITIGDVNFGDDSSEWSNDGECDDPRFSGEGMTSTPLLDSDRLADATDCSTAFQAGTITLLGAEQTETATEALIIDDVVFGTDSGDWANDGECDDPRFEGEGMTSTPLLEEDIMADATDCSTAFQAGTITLIGPDEYPIPAPTEEAALDFGDDSSQWSSDGECDDPRFEGEGMTTTVLLENDKLRDATDCKAAFEAGTITLKTE